MNPQPPKQTSNSSIERLLLLLALLIFIDIGLLLFLRSHVATILLLRDQRTHLEQDQKILVSAEGIYQTYKQDIEKIMEVFPDEKTVLDFLQILEGLTKEAGSDSVVKFSSRSPLPEGDKLFLLFTITIKTDEQRLSNFLTSLETLPYMTRVLLLSLNFPEGKRDKIDATIQMKLYVQNPFTTR